MLHDGLFEVELGEGGVPGVVRRPVDGGAVLADAQLGYVGDVGGGSDLDHLGSAEPVHRQVGDLGHHRRGGAYRQGTADFEPQLGDGPGRVLPLDFGDGDPGSAGLVMLVDVRVAPVGRGVGPDVLVGLRQGL